MLRHWNAFKALKCSFDINVSLKWEVVMTKCLHTISRCHARHHWARAWATAMAVNRGGSAALPTHFPLNCPNIYSFYSGLSNKQGCGFVSEAKARIGGSVSADRGQARSGAGRMLAAQCGHRHRSQNSKTWGMIRNITVEYRKHGQRGV